MKNQELNPLELFFKSSSDACNLECSEQEELENRFAEWWKNNQQQGYSEEEVLNFTQTIIMQYKFGNTNIEQMDLLKETLQLFKNK